MNIVFLTTDDPIYLPWFFDRVLSARVGATGVFVVPPLYKNQGTVGAAWRYFRTFGAGAAWALMTRVIRARLQKQSIARACEQHGVLCESVRDVNDPAFLERLRSMDTDLIVSVSCPQVFKKPLIDLPKRGCVNIHGAILPAYRGVMPSFWMLANGEEKAGVSIFFVNEDLDAGELCGQEVFDIKPRETLDEFVRRSKVIAAELLLDVLRQIDEGAVRCAPLDAGAGSYYSWPSRDAVRRFKAAGRKLW